MLLFFLFYRGDEGIEVNRGDGISRGYSESGGSY